MFNPFDTQGPLDTLTLALERGWRALERGDFRAAAAVADEALSMDSNSVDAHCLGAAVAMLHGDNDLALAHVRTAVAISPDSSLALIQGADLLLYSHSQPEAAAELAARAVACARAPIDRAEALFLLAESQLALARLAEATETLRELSSLPLPSAADRTRAGNLWLAAEEPTAARQWFESALEIDGDRADAHYGLGVLAEREGDQRGATVHWLQTLAADSELPACSWHLSEVEFAASAQRALALLPAHYRELLAHVAVMVAERPSPDDVASGLDPRVLGSCSAPAAADAIGGAGKPALATLHLYQANLESCCRDREQLEREIAITMWRETAHTFGLSDDDSLGPD